MTRPYTLELTLDLPPDDLVVNVRLIPTISGRIVVCQTEEGWRTLPGGSRDRGESVEDAARRELLEEAGCQTSSRIFWFASFTVASQDEPWRSWHPFPVSAWLVGSRSRADDGADESFDGERVVAVHTLPPLEAHAYLSGFDNGGQADLIALAADLGHL